MVNQKVDPLPSSDSTPISPFKIEMIVLQMESPRPVPCLNISNLTKRSNLG